MGVCEQRARAQELRKLKHSFDHWKETFKKRMRDTYAFVQRARTHHSRRPAAGGPLVTRSSRGTSEHVPPSRHHPSTPHQNFHPLPQQPVTSSRINPNADPISPLSPASSDSMASPSENYVQKMREGMLGATKKGSEVMKGMVGKLSRSIGTREVDATRVSVTPQGTIDHGHQQNGGRH
jgi:hypothetical protein